MSEDAAPVGVSAADEARNRAFGAGLVDDPYPHFHELRGTCPVRAGSIASQFPAMAARQGLVPRGSSSFSTYSFDVLRRHDVFSSKGFYEGLESSIGPTIISMDEPEHRRMRSLVQPAFARREMERWGERIIRPIVDEYLDRIVPLGRADIYSDIGSTVPVHTIAAALGLPVADRQQFFEWSLAMTASDTPPDARHQASQAVAAYVAPLIAERRAVPRDDLLSTLVNAGGARRCWRWRRPPAAVGR